MDDSVLVTGAFGLVGSATVVRLRAAGHHVVVTELDNAVNRKAARGLPSDIEVRWADLTDDTAVSELVSDINPTAIIHLAAIIPPLCYARPEVARKVNVGATQSVIRAAEAQADPPRVVFASSVAVHGSRNPHRISELLSGATPHRPTEIYGAHKAAAEMVVRESKVPWVVLRLGGVMSTTRFSVNLNNILFEGMLPSNGRLQTVDVRDVACAFTAAVTADVTGEILMIGGDDATHRITQSEVAESVTRAIGLTGGMPKGRPGDPDDDDNWFATDWMDTKRAQEMLSFQQHSWPDMLAEIRAGAGLRRHALPLFAPIVRAVLTRRSAYRKTPGHFADFRTAVAAHWPGSH